jgi:hypothetical protein
MLAIWSHPNDPAREMERYGTGMATALADTSAGHLLHADAINLAVIAQHLTGYAEISGVVFFDIKNNIVGLHGSTDSPARYSAAATLDDTMTGSVSIYLNRDAFQAPLYVSNWALSAIALAGAPFLTLGILGLSSRGRRSLPIVSVPEPTPPAPEQAYLLVANLHNQLALSRHAQSQALDDALAMAHEVCALYQGIPVVIPSRGVALVLNATNVGAQQAVYAAFLMQALLASYETEGKFRCYLTTTMCPGNPAEVEALTLDDLREHVDFDALLPIAALAKAGTALFSEDVYTALNDMGARADLFEHPIVEDLKPGQPLYTIAALPPAQAQLVSDQAELILGFSLATA